MNIKIIVNPRAGDGKAREAGYQVEKFLCERGIEYSLDSTFRPCGATALAKKAITEGFDLIIAVGGDGTVNEIVNGMLASSASLAVVPAGRENNFARMLGLDPSNIIEACEAAIGQSEKMMDVGKINDVCFLNSIGIGLNAEAAKIGNCRLIKGPFGYLLKLLSALKSYKPKAISLKVNDVGLSSRPVMAKVSNGRFFGGGMSLSPDADPQDGKFDICLVNDIGKLRLLYHLPKLFGQKHNRSYPLSMFRSETVTIECDSPMNASYDGELLEGFSKYHIKFADKRIPVKTK